MSNGYPITQELFLDWLSFSFKYDDLRAYNSKYHKNYNQFDYLFKVAFPELDQIHYAAEVNFRSIYDKCIRCSYDILVYYDTEDKQDKGCYITVPSHSIQYFCLLFGCKNIFDLFKLVIKRGGSFSRLDICYDDYSKKFSPRNFRDWFESGMMNTRLRRYSYHCSGKGNTGTFYLGNRAGLRMLRIYDKLYESSVQYAKGLTDEVIDSVRYEFELHSYAAQDFAKFLIENSEISFSWLVGQFFKIIVRDNNDTSRCSILPEWEDWLSNLSFANTDIKFQVQQRPKSYLRSRYWFKRCAMAVAQRVYHHEGEAFIEEIRNGFAAESVKDDSDFLIYEEVLKKCLM